MRTLFSLSAALAAFLAVAWLAFPGVMLTGWGVHGDNVTVYVARRYGALFIGYAVLLWLARSAEPGRSTTAILAGGAVVTAVIGIISLLGALTGIVGPLIWSAVVIEITLAVAFTSFLLRAREASVRETAQRPC
jgi:hypothetical protein